MECYNLLTEKSKLPFLFLLFTAKCFISSSSSRDATESHEVGGKWKKPLENVESPSGAQSSHQSASHQNISGMVMIGQGAIL